MMVKQNIKIGLVGVGNMGSAIYEALIEKYDIESIYACDRNQDKMEKIDDDHKYLEPDNMIDKVDVIILAIKPQNFDEFVECVDKEKLENKLIISIMAGITVKKISQKLKIDRVIRAMPNLAIKHKKGFTGWIASTGTNNYDKNIARDIFGVMGLQTQLFDESKIDAITALSGSGPAYFMLIADVIKSQAKEFGFGENQAKLIANSTLMSSASLVKNEFADPKDFIEAVSSKGGTTEAAFREIKKDGLRKRFSRAIKAAYNRARELNL